MAQASVWDGIRGTLRGLAGSLRAAGKGQALGSTLALVLGLAGCVAPNHPLSAEGNLEILFDKSPLFAVDVLDPTGKPVLPRQVPYEKPVSLYLTSSQQPDFGAYVDIQLDQPGALTLVPDGETCEQLEGSFRCTAAADGFARFTLRSDSDFSGEVELSAIGRPASRRPVTIKPAGLPEDATGFELLLEGVSGSQVLARYNQLACSLEPVPDQSFDKWPAGEVRVRAAEIRASGPPATPGVVEHAPVIIETLHPEAFVTLDKNCSQPRTNRLRLQLDAIGRSPTFYFCFSTLGGSEVALQATSGAKQLTRRLDVLPEPHLLRVVTQQQQLSVVDGPVEAVTVAAYDADLRKVAMPIDLSSSDSLVLLVPSATNQTQSGSVPDTPILLRPLSPGQATISVRPRLFDLPVCLSKTITVSP